MAQINDNLKNNFADKENPMGRFEYLKGENRVKLTIFKSFVHHYDDKLIFGA